MYVTLFYKRTIEQGNRKRRPTVDNLSLASADSRYTKKVDPDSKQTFLGLCVYSLFILRLFNFNFVQILTCFIVKKKIQNIHSGQTPAKVCFASVKLGNLKIDTP